MLGFVVPFKAAANSNDWSEDCKNLATTLESISRQSISQFKVFVVYTDLPKRCFCHEKISYIEFPFPFLKAREIADYDTVVRMQFTDVVGERMYDQGKRILFGCSFAKKAGCTFIMSVDSDDLVSNKIAAFVQANNAKSIGWFVNKGFIWPNGSRVLIRVKKNMNFINGSTHIVNSSNIPDFIDSECLADFSFFSSHGYLNERLRVLYGKNLNPLPFYALIYVLHGNNWSNYGAVMRRSWFKTGIKKLIGGKFFSKKLKKEFGLQ